MAPMKRKFGGGFCDVISSGPSSSPEGPEGFSPLAQTQHDTCIEGVVDDYVQGLQFSEPPLELLSEEEPSGSQRAPDSSAAPAAPTAMPAGPAPAEEPAAQPATQPAAAQPATPEAKPAAQPAQPAAKPAKPAAARMQDLDAELVAENRKQQAKAPARPKNKDLKTLQQLEAAVQAQELPAAHPLIQAMRRKLPPDELTAYKDLRNDVQRKAFRLKWAKQELQALKISKEHSQSWHRVEASTGTYLTLAAVAERYGYAVDPDGALEAAGRYCRKCAAMAGPWAKWDSMGGVLLYLFLQVERREVLDECWSLYERGDVDAFEGEGGDGGASSTGGAPAAKGKAKAKAKAKGKAKEGTKEGELAEEEGPGPVVLAGRLRTKVMSNLAKAQALVDRVGGKVPEWQWADSPELAGSVSSALAGLKAELQAQNFDLIVGTEPRDWRLSLKGPALREVTALFVQNVKGPCERLGEAYERLQRMQRARG